MATWLGGLQLADPTAGQDGCVRSAIDIGSRHETQDGSVYYDYVGTRYKFDLAWVGISFAEMEAIRGKYEVKAEQAFSPPEEATSFDVIVIGNTWMQSYQNKAGGIQLWDCSMSVEETSV